MIRRVVQEEIIPQKKAECAWENVRLSLKIDLLKQLF